MNLNALKSQIHRLRERWKDALMAQVAATLGRAHARQHQGGAGRVDWVRVKW